MNPRADTELERRWMRPAGIAALAGALAVVGATFGQAQVLSGSDSDAVQLRDFHAHAGTVVLLALCVAAGFSLFILPLVHLFRAAAGRDVKVRNGLMGLMLAGPLFVGASVFVTAIALTGVASDFVTHNAAAAQTDKLAHHMITSSTAVQIGTGLGFAGKLGVAFAVFYACMMAMRNGLLTRFVGTFGMAVGAVFVLISFGVLIFFVILGLVFLGIRPLPPAWEAGVSMPWPPPGEAKPSPPASEQSEDVGDEKRQMQSRRKRKRRR